jgi:phosphatidylglycerophosphatase C
MRVAIFDFDGTLVSRDSFRIFGRLAAETWWDRFWVDLQSARLKLTPEANVTYKQRVLRSVWAPKAEGERRASIGQLRRRMHELAYPTMVEALAAHSQGATRTLIVTASPEFYVKPIVESWISDVEVYGLKVIEEDDNDLAVDGMYGSDKADLVCSLFGKQLVEAEVHVYTDNKSDMPLLRLADQAVLVCPSARLIRRVREANSPYEIESPTTRAQC